MLALTLRQPYPWAICRLGCRIANRAWKPGDRLRPGERFAIHGGKPPGPIKYRGYFYREAVALAQRGGAFGPLPGQEDAWFGEVIAFAGIVATARYDGFIAEKDRDASDPWFEGPYGWILGDVEVLPEPIPFTGEHGLWAIPRALEAEMAIPTPPLARK